MADSKISALAAATSLASTDEFVIATGGVSKKVTMATLLASLPMVLVHDETLGIDTASFDVTSIPGSYKHLRIIGYLRGAEAATVVNANLRLNNDSGSNYDMQAVFNNTVSTMSGAETIAAALIELGQVPADSATAAKFGALEADIPNYAGTVGHKAVNGRTGRFYGETTADGAIFLSTGIWRSTSAITRVTVLPSAGSWLAGSRLTIYGLN